MCNKPITFRESPAGTMASLSLYSPHLKSDGEGGELGVKLETEKILEDIEQLNEDSMLDFPGLIGAFIRLAIMPLLTTCD